MSWIAQLAQEVAGRGPIARVTIIRAEGSTPRECGAAMLVGRVHSTGTIGGGALEQEAVAHARYLLASHGEVVASRWPRDTRSYALGPALGQCCGGHAWLLFELFGPRERDLLEALANDPRRDGALIVRPLAGGAGLEAVADRKTQGDWPLAVTRAVRDMLAGARPREAVLVRVPRAASAWFLEPMARRTVPLIIYGAGHVGRALVRALQDLPFAITWVDTAAARLPAAIPSAVRAEIARNPAAFAAATPPGAFHIVMTYSHTLDLAICHAVLTRSDFGYLGLIGSHTKRARFARRLGDSGIDTRRLSRLICPIGLPGLPGKEPAIIATSVAADLLRMATAKMDRCAPPELTRQDRAP
jgi:xanthine dehydrogenase accessory factor